MNIPYIKVYENGVLTNPIKGKYLSKSPNRRQRRKKLGRLFSNKKGVQLVVTKIGPTSFVKSKKYITVVEGNFVKNNMIKRRKGTVNYGE